MLYLELWDNLAPRMALSETTAMFTANKSISGLGGLSNPPVDYPQPEPSAEQTSTFVSRSSEKYSLRPRSIQKRIETQSRQLSVGIKKPPKPKQKPPPLSKYRRRTANARERFRMQEINEAFETLQKVVPNFPVQSTSDKVTKITTLRLAVDYIQSLTDILQQCEEEDTVPVYPTNTTQHPSLIASTATMLATPTMADYATHIQQTSATKPSTLPGFDTFTYKGSFGSLGSSSSVFSEFLSDDDSPFIDNFDVFDDLPSIPMNDTLDMLLDSDGESLNFNSDLSDQSTP